MAAVNWTLSEEQFMCSICLSAFIDPVSTPCGHNFCKNCISQYWNKSNKYVCPLCKEEFDTRPQLRTNTLLSNMEPQFLPPEQTEMFVGEEASDSDVSCDVCTGTKLKAVSSCLVCLVSYCQTHLDPHKTVSVLKHHQLVDPVRHLEERMCAQHHKALELFCKTDSVCVCTQCSYSEHKSHEIVPLNEACEDRKADFKKMMEASMRKLEKIHRCLDLNHKAAAKETADGQEVFKVLGQSVQKNLEELKKGVQVKLRKKENQVKVFINELEEEISQLEKGCTEMDKPAYAQDHLHFLQTFTPLTSNPKRSNRLGLHTRQASFEGAVVRSLLELEKNFTEVLDYAYKADLKIRQKCAVNVTLDPDTAHANLILSHDKKQVHHREVKKNVQENLTKFLDIPFVLGQQFFSTGRFYFEVEVTGKTQWFLGIATVSINRTKEKKLGPSHGSWIIYLKDGKLSAASNPAVAITLRRSLQKIGVFADYEEGIVSFHDVETAAPIYFFTDCGFKEALLPFFSPWYAEKGRNKSPMVITRVSK